MSTRKIKNAKDVTTDELIYFKSHAQATFMSDGTTVEDAINNLQQGTDVNSVYVTDFTIQDLVDLRNTQDVEFIFVDKSSLSAALAEQKLILVRESSDETVKGYHILTGYEDDLMYLTIHDYGSNSYYIETAHSQDNDSFYKNEVGQVIVQERLVTGNNIKSVCGESLVDGVGDITPSFLSVGSTNPHILNLPFGFQNGRYFCKDLESNVRTLVCNLSSDYYYGYISVAREYHPPVLLSLRDIANTETAIASQTFTIYYDSTSHDVYVTAGMSGKVHIRSCSGITKLPKDWYATFIDLTIDAGQEEFRRFLNNNNYDNLLGVTVRLSNDNAETVVFTITNVSGDGINDVMLSGAGPAYSVQTNTFDYTDFSTLTFTKTPFSSGGNTGASAPAFGTCVDAVAVVNKTVQVSGDFPTQLVDNTRVSVLFQYANLAANPTMNVNGTGAYPIMWKNANTASWIANQIYDFVYYNECWYLLGGVDTDTNTDTKVTTSVTTTNNTFPLLFTYTANKANNIAEAARFATDLKYNPATKELTHGGLSFTDSNGNNVSLPTVTESTTLVAENNLKTINGESIVGNGDITVSGGSGGITIVNSVDELDADAPTGTLACVVEGGGGGSVSIRDLSTVTMNDMDENGFIITEGLPQVSGIAIEPYALADIDNLVKLLSELDMTALSGEAGVWFCSENTSISATSGKIAMVSVMYADTIDIIAAGMDAATGSQSMWNLATLSRSSGEWLVDDGRLNEFNNYINGMYYIGFFMHYLNEISLPSDTVYDIYDNALKVVAGAPSKAFIYQKLDSWEELYKKDFDKLTETLEYVNVGVDEAFRYLDELSASAVFRRSTNETYSSQVNVYWGNHCISHIRSGSYECILHNISTDYCDEYTLELICESTPSAVVFKCSNDEFPIRWANGNAPIFEAGYTYAISIVRGLGVFAQFPNS